MQISGKVASVRKDGRGFKVGDDWYSLGTRTVPAYAPEWKSNVVVDYLEQADEKGRPERFVMSWQGENAVPRATESASSRQGADRPDWDARLGFDKEKHPVITRLAVLNTAVAYFGLLPTAPTGPTVAEVLAVAAQFETWASGKSGSPMVEAAVRMGATVEPTLSNDMAAWANEPRTPDQREELITLLSERGLKESWVVEQGFTTPGVQLSRMAAANAILKLKQMVVI